MGYFEVPALSNSGMSGLNPAQNGSPKRFRQATVNDDKYNLSLDRGSLLHLAILEPDKFVLQDVDRPSGMMGTFIEYYRTLQISYEQEHGSPLVQGSAGFGKLLGKAVELSGYKLTSMAVWTKYQADPNNLAYYAYLAQSEGKLSVTRDTRAVLDSCILNLKNHPVANNLLFQTPELVQTWNELEVYWIEKVEIIDENGFEVEVDVPCKAKVDRLRYHEGNQRFQNVDLKTTSQGLGNFYKSFNDYRYYRQNAFYDKAVREFAKQQDIVCEGVTHLNVVVETIGLNEVGVYKSTPDWLRKGTIECEELLHRYAWHSHHNKWEYPKEYYQNGGLLTLPPCN